MQSVNDKLIFIKPDLIVLSCTASSVVLQIHFSPSFPQSLMCLVEFNSYWI